MKNFKKLSVLILALLVFYGCENDKEEQNLAPTAPKLMKPADKAEVDTTLTFEWQQSLDPEKDEVTYTLSLSTEQSMKNAKIVEETKELRATAKLVAGTKYFWQVTATDVKGNIVTSDARSFTVRKYEKEPEIPSLTKPNLVFPADQSDGVEKTISFKWNKVENASSYELSYDKSEDMSSAKTVNSISDTLHQIDLEQGVKYFWKIKVLGSNNAFQESSVFSFTTKVNPPSSFNLVAPLKDSVLNEEDKNLKWNKANNGELALTYTVYLDTTKLFTDKHKIATDIADTVVALPSLIANKTYFWKVVAKNSKGVTTESSIFNFKTLEAPGAAKAFSPENNLVGANYKAGKFNRLYWNCKYKPDYSGIISTVKDCKYDVYFSKDETFEENEKILTNSADFSVNYGELLPNTKYFWKVITYKNGYSVASDVWNFTTRNFHPTKPQNITVTKQTLTSDGVDASISWDASTDEENNLIKYDVYITTSWSVKITHRVASDLTTTKYDFKGLPANKVHRVIVVAKDAYGAYDLSDHSKFQLTTIKPVSAITESTVELFGKQYKTVTVDGVTWLAENFAHLPYLSADSDKKAFVYGYTGTDLAEAKNHANYSKYGVMYNQAMLKDAAVIPAGWHVPTDDEWKAIEKASGMSEDDADNSSYRGTVANKFMSTESGVWASFANASNEMKFNALPGGYYKATPYNTFAGVGSYTYFWTSTGRFNPMGGKTSYVHRAISGSKSGILRNTTKDSSFGMYVRLVKDSE